MDNGLNIISFIQSKPLLYFTLFVFICINVLLVILFGFSIYYLINIGNQHVDHAKQVKIRKKHFFYCFVILICFLIFIIIYHFRHEIWKLFSPIVWAIIFSYLLNPIVHKIHIKGISRFWSVMILYVSILTIVIIFSLTIIPKIVKEAKNLIELLPIYTRETNKFLNEIYIRIEELDNFSPQWTSVKEPIQEYLINVQYNIIHFIHDITRSIFTLFSEIVTLVLIPIYAFYFLKDVDYFRKKVIFVIPKAFRHELIHIFRDIDMLLSKFIRGQIIVAACVGIMSTITLLFIQVDFAFLLGIITGIFNVIPYIGPIIGAIPAVIFALLDEPSKAFWVILAFIIIQQIESAVLSPKIVGESVGLHPIVVILTLFIGNELLGIIGMLFAVPVAASIKIISRYIVDFIAKF